jgi:hypothetical protein
VDRQPPFLMQQDLLLADHAQVSRTSQSNKVTDWFIFSTIISRTRFLFFTLGFFPGEHTYRKPCAVKIAQIKFNKLFTLSVAGS